MTNVNQPVQKKRKIRTVIFSVLTLVFTLYIFIFPSLWIFALVMALLSAGALFFNLRLNKPI